ncbi:MAG TPA: hypothetical protein DD714_00345 [Candidatus Omnitrophica bacterium]|nr:hypothetical protein [Candidatus Omnitrophota bacterium]
MSTTQGVLKHADAEVAARWEPLLAVLTPLNRTIVSDDMERAADLLDQAMGRPATRFRYPSGREYGSWVVPPSWNVREAFLSDGKRVIASYQDHALFLAPYSAPFEGWVSKAELLKHLNVSTAFEDAFIYQHRLAYDFQKRLRGWEISLPQRIAASLDGERYFLKIDVDVRPSTMNVLEYTVEGTEETTVAFLSHLCHPGQANDGLSGVLAGMALLQRIAVQPHRFTYKLLVMPETIGSAVHVIAQGLSTKQIACAVFLETMGTGERLFLKRSRTGGQAIDLALNSVAREHPEIGVHDFYDGYGNDELVFDFANVGIPSIGVQHYPFAQYHTSRDGAEIIEWEKWTRAVEVALEVFRRLEADRLIQLKYPGPPYLSRYRLYADAVTERARFRQNAKLLMLCDGCHTLLQMCEASGLPFDEVEHFFGTLAREGLLSTP